MKRAGKIAAGLAALMMTMGAASAADVPPMVMPVAQAPVPIAPPAPTFDWDGFYVGASGAYFFGYPFVAVQAGYNGTIGRLLAGVEFAAYVWPERVLQFTGRLGFLVTDRVLIYARAAYARPLFDDFNIYGLGAGVEVALGQRMSVFAEGGIIGIFEDGCCVFGARAGVNFHLGN